MTDITTELTNLMNTKKGSVMKESIISALKKIYKAQGGVIDTAVTEREWNFSRAITLSGYHYEMDGLGLEQGAELIDSLAVGINADTNEKVYFTVHFVKRNGSINIVLGGQNGTYHSVRVRVQYRYDV